MGSDRSAADDGQARRQKLVEELRSRQLTVTAVESCTGGALAAAIVDVPGASEVLSAALVTYSNEAKTRLAGVSEATLSRFGAVSPETAEEMAKGGLAAAGADLALATTGYAGPDAGDAEHPAGLVYIAAATGETCAVERHRFSGDRGAVRAQAVEAALSLGIRILEGEDR